MKFKGLLGTNPRTLACAAVALAWGLSPLHAAERPAETKWTLGTEIDTLPFATKGYYASVVAGHDRWRFRGVVARSTMPSFLISNGFRDKRTDAYALLADRFFGAKSEKQEGFWIGGGVEYWRSRIRTDEASAFAHYDNAMLTVGSGYVWRISKHIYLNPWGGGHFTVGGARTIQVSGKTYDQPLFTPETSIKFGITF